MGELASPLTIRAHHLLCVLGFRGLGYSQEFIATMEKVVRRMRSDSAFPIIVVAGCDIICASCPHNKGSKCLKEADSERKVEGQDLEVLNRLGFELGAQITAGNVWARIKERLTPKDVTEICRGCEWLGLGHCVRGLARLKTPAQY